MNIILNTTIQLLLDFTVITFAAICILSQLVLSHSNTALITSTHDAINAILLCDLLSLHFILNHNTPHGLCYSNSFINILQLRNASIGVCLSEFLINPPNPSFWTRGEIVGCTETHLHIGHMNLPRRLFLLQTLMGGGDFFVNVPYVTYFVGPTDKREWNLTNF